MTLIEDARRLADREPVTLVGDEANMRWECSACDAEADIGFPCRKPSPFPHAADCPWLAMPWIVAALEAAERLVERDPEEMVGGDPPDLQCVFCSETIGEWSGQRDDQDEPIYSPLPHGRDCPWQALVAALRGEGVTA